MLPQSTTIWLRFMITNATTPKLWSCSKRVWKIIWLDWVRTILTPKIPQEWIETVKNHDLDKIPLYSKKKLISELTKGISNLA